MANKKILLVEDDPNFGTVLKDYLALNDYDVHHAKDGLDGLIAFKNDDFDICILDVMMPKKDGFEVNQFLKNDERTSHIPIILLTAKADIKDKQVRYWSVWQEKTDDALGERTLNPEDGI